MIQALELSYFGESLLRLFYPSYCGGCASLLEIEEKHLCRDCSSHLSLLAWSPQEQLLNHSEGPIDEVWSLFSYEGLVKKIIGEIKFSNKRWLISLFTQALRETSLRLASLKPYDFIIPIPMDRSKRVQREFHAVHLIAKMVSRATSSRCLARTLIKHRRTLAQSALTREERLINPYGSFKVRPSKRLQNSRVLLIDDVLTTGATTNEAARALKAARFKSVDLLTLARTGIKA